MRLPVPRCSASMTLSLAGALLIGASPIARMASAVSLPETLSSDCPGSAIRIDLGFASGAAWTLCATIESANGAGRGADADQRGDMAGALRLEQVAYHAPGDRLRSVLRDLHPAALRVQAHRRTDARGLLPGLRPLPAERCPSDARALSERAALCLSRRSTGLLYRYGDISGGQGARHDLDLLQANAAGTTVRQRVSFGETGTIRPSLTLHDPGTTLPAADSSLQVTWRIAFALDSAAADRVEELDFALPSEHGSRRQMRVLPLRLETHRGARHQAFRGWRVIDAGGAGYYLDSQQAVGGWSSAGGDSADAHALPAPILGVSAYAAHERDANRLPAYLNRESMADRSPVLWYAATALLMPTADAGTASSATTGFVLSPLDWTAHSPFAPPPGS